MPSDLPLFNSILHLHLRPWKTTGSEQKFRQLLHSLPKENYHQQPLYEVSFPKPLSEKTKYYQAVLNNEAITYLNSLHYLITASSNNNEKKFHIHTALSKRLKDKLEDTERVIAARQLFFSTLDENRHDKQQRDNAWIIQYLKYQLIRLFLEIQNSYPEFLNDDPLTEEDIHSKYFTETVQSLIKTAPELGLPKSTIQKPSSIERNEFNPIKGDFRSEKKGILSYKEIIKRPDVFALFEIALFEVELIDNEYNFTNKHTEKQKLAAIYCWLILKRYFIKRNFEKRKDIKYVDVRKFLDYRYNANVDAQFRAWWKSRMN